MMSQHYHRLADMETDALWDQLNDEQSREVQQHQSRFQAVDPRNSRTSHWVIVQSMMWSTLIRTGASVSSAWRAAKEAWKHHGGDHHNHHHQRHRSTDFDFDEQFGIHDLRPTEFAEEGNYSTSETRRNAVGEGRPNPGYPFVVLQQYPSQRAIQREQEHWGIVANMDVFLQNLYQYYYHRGLIPMVCKFLVEFVSLTFTLWLSRILLQRVDWQQLATCKDEHTCRANWSDYYYEQPPSFSHRWLVHGYTILFVAYAVFSVWTFWQSLQQAWKCQYIMHEKLGISRRKLQGGSVSWDSVVQQLVEAQDSGIYRTALSRLDPLVIAQRILRKENFLLAFFNQNLLQIQIGQRQYWCPTLEWTIHVCVLNFMFNHKYELRPAFVLDPASLERRFIVCGIIHVLLLPFLIMFLSLHFLFRNVYDFKTSKQYMGNKQWSTVAQWTFREFNELPHVLERRLEPSYAASENYLKLFGQSEWMAALGKLLVFAGGAVGGVLLVLGVLNDAILLHVQLWGRNLLWYAGIAGIVYSVGKGLLPTKEAQPSVTRNLFADMDAALKVLSTHTHYYPEHWKGRGWDPKVRSQFGMMFDSKVKLFFWELISLVLAPYILVAKLSKCAPAICEFCMAIKAKAPGAGDVCGYSTFDFDAFKDEAWDGKTLGQSTNLSSDSTAPPQTTNHESLAESILRTGSLEEAARQHPKPKARDGKMEKSFFDFQAAHPSWKCSPSGQFLVDRVKDYRQAELAAMSRERNLYIAAAARQLETLVQMEQDRDSAAACMVVNPKVHFEQERFNDFHHSVGVPASTSSTPTTSTTTADDADAGTHPSPSFGPIPYPTVPRATAATMSPSRNSYLNTSNLHTNRSIRSHSANSTSLLFSSNVDEADQGSTSLAPPPPSYQTTTETSMRHHLATSAAQSTGTIDPLHYPNPHHHPAHLSASTGTSLTLATAATNDTTSTAIHRDAFRAGLSTELQRLLTLSTSLEQLENSVLAVTPPLVDPHVDSTTPHGSGDMLMYHPDRTAALRQYYWLERFHEHLESQQEQEQQQAQYSVSASAPQPTMSSSAPLTITVNATATSSATIHDDDNRSVPTGSPGTHYPNDGSSSSNMV